MFLQFYRSPWYHLEEKSVVLPAIPFAKDAEGSRSPEEVEAGCCRRVEKLGRAVPLEVGCSPKLCHRGML